MTNVARRNLMPDLAHLDSKNSLNAMLNVVLGGRGIIGHPGQGLLTIYVRMMDKAILEYEAARATFTEWVTTPNNVMSPLFRTIDHLETCVDSLHRASVFAERLRHLQSAPAIDRVKLPRTASGIRFDGRAMRSSTPTRTSWRGGRGSPPVSR